MNLMKQMDKSVFLKYVKRYNKLDSASLNQEIKNLNYSILSIEAYQLIFNMYKHFNWDMIVYGVINNINNPIPVTALPAYIKFFIMQYIDGHKYNKNFYSMVNRCVVEKIVNDTFDILKEVESEDYETAVKLIQKKLWLHWNTKAENVFGHSVFSCSRPCHIGVEKNNVVISYIDESYSIPPELALSLLQQELQVAHKVKNNKKNDYIDKQILIENFYTQVLN